MNKNFLIVGLKITVSTRSTVTSNSQIQRKPWSLNGVDAASQENIDMYR